MRAIVQLNDCTRLVVLNFSFEPGSHRLFGEFRRGASALKINAVFVSIFTLFFYEKISRTS